MPRRGEDERERENAAAYTRIYVLSDICCSGSKVIVVVTTVSRDGGRPGGKSSRTRVRVRACVRIREREREIYG